MAVARPFNPFLVGGVMPSGSPYTAPLMNPTPMAQQPLIQPMPQRPTMTPQLMGAQPMGPMQTFGQPFQVPGGAPLGAGAAALGTPQPGAPAGGGRLSNFLGSDAALAMAAGILEGGTSGQAIGRGFNYALQAKNKATATTDDISEYAFAKQQGYTGSFMDFVKEREARSAGTELGLNPVYYYDEQGNIKAGQVSKDGKFKPIDIPGGGDVLSPGEKAADTAAGKKVGEAAVNLPTVENAANRMLSTIDSLLQDEALPSVTGPIEGRLPAYTGNKARAQSKIDQIQGAAFLQAFNDLRGGGQITEAEGSKATAAYNRLSAQMVNDEDYRAALDEFRAEVIRLVEIARQKASSIRTTIPTGGEPLGGGAAPADPLGIR